MNGKLHITSVVLSCGVMFFVLISVNLVNTYRAELDRYRQQSNEQINELCDRLNMIEFHFTNIELTDCELVYK